MDNSRYQNFDEAVLEGMTLPEIMDPARRFDVLRLCREVEQFGDPIRGVKLARIFAKHIQSNAVAQLSPKDHEVFDELYAWALFSGLEAQPEEVAADLFSKHLLLLLQDDVNVLARVKHIFRVWGEMDGTIVYRTYLLQALLKDNELLGNKDIDVPGEAPVRPTVKAWIEAYERAVRRESRTNIDRARFLMANSSALALTETQRKTLVSLFEIADELIKKPVTLGIMRVPGEEKFEEGKSSQGLVEQYVGKPFNQQTIREAQERIAGERTQGRDILDILNEALTQKNDADVVAVLFLLARDRKLGSMLKDENFRSRLTDYVATTENPRALLKSILDRATGGTDESAQLGAQLASLLVAQGERDYLGMVVFSQASGKYEWRV